MATISENIQRINKAKTDIKNAIIAKGGSVADADKIDAYAQAIEALPSGGGTELPQNLSRFVTDDWGIPKKITIKGSVTTISDNAYKNGPIEDVIIGNGVTSIGNSAFSSCSNLTAITIPDSVTSIGGNAFSSCSALTAITIPNSVTSIGSDAFNGCRSLISVVIGNGVTTISDGLFRDCRNLRNIVIPDSVTSIGEGPFEFCNSLTSIVIPDSVTSIGNMAFYLCPDLTSVAIGNGVRSIGIDAFNTWNNYTVTISATTPPTLSHGRPISGSVTAIYVPSDSVDAYKAADGWSDYADKIQPIQ